MSKRQHSAADAAARWEEAMELAAANNSICFIGVVAAGALFAFLLGAFAWFMQSDASQRTVFWFLCVIGGAVLGITTARGASGQDANRSEADAGDFNMPLLLATVASTTTAMLLYCCLPHLPFDHLVASIVAGFAAWLGHPVLLIAQDVRLHGLSPDTLSTRRIKESLLCGVKSFGDVLNDATSRNVNATLPATPRRAATIGTFIAALANPTVSEKRPGGTNSQLAGAAAAMIEGASPAPVMDQAGINSSHSSV